VARPQFAVRLKAGTTCRSRSGYPPSPEATAGRKPDTTCRSRPA